MKPSSDPYDEMGRFLSTQDAEELLSGTVGADALPSDAAELHRMFAVMRQPADVSDARAEQAAIAAIAAEIRSTPPAPDVIPISRAGRRISAKATAIAFAAVLASGTAAAATASGSLPSGVQRTVASALSHVNISVPDPSRGNSPRRPAQPAGSRPPRGSLPENPPGSGSPAGNGNNTELTTPASANGKGNGKGKGNSTTHTTPSTPASANGNGNGKGKGKGKGKGNSTTHTTPSTPASANGNGNGNGKGNGKATSTTVAGE